MTWIIEINRFQNLFRGGKYWLPWIRWANGRRCFVWTGWLIHCERVR